MRFEWIGGRLRDAVASLFFVLAALARKPQVALVASRRKKIYR
jgi:hypothetical protein